MTLLGSTPHAQPVETTSGGTGLIAVYDDVTVPEPSTLVLVTTGLMVIGLRRRRRR